MSRAALRTLVTAALTASLLGGPGCALARSAGERAGYYEKPAPERGEPGGWRWDRIVEDALWLLGAAGAGYVSGRGRPLRSILDLVNGAGKGGPASRRRGRSPSKGA